MVLEEGYEGRIEIIMFLCGRGRFFGDKTGFDKGHLSDGGSGKKDFCVWLWRKNFKYIDVVDGIEIKRGKGKNGCRKN